VLTDTARSPNDAVRFVLRAVALSLGLFGLLRLNWIEAHAVLPFTQMQGARGLALFGAAALPVETTLACSGADALALCLGAVLAYPVRWRARLAGAAGGAGVIVSLNILRIGSLGRVADSPAWFSALHLYVWPALLTLAIAGYVFGWMRLADRRLTKDEVAAASDASSGRPRPARRFLFLTAAFLLVFSATSSFYLESSAILALAGFMARAAAAMLSLVGISAHAASNVLWTSNGGFLVTQECISTPLIPVYLAAVCVYSPTWRRLIAGVAAVLPLFTALGIIRLLLVAVPGVIIGSPLFVVHAFYQLLLGACVVCLAAFWRHGGRSGLRHALAGVVAGGMFVVLAGPWLARAVLYPAGGPLDDPQGAIAFLPAFQVGLYLALWVAATAGIGWGRFLAGLALLGVTQVAGLFTLHALAGHSGFTAHVRDVRGWAVVGPVLIFAAVINLARTRR
jgi:exosortase/archaeosortase family protein